MNSNDINTDNSEIIVKNGEKSLKGELTKIIGEELCRIARDKKLAIDYITICACALELIEFIFGQIGRAHV